MFKKILLPLDLTDRHAAALQLAAELARQGGGEVTLLHVVEVIPAYDIAENTSFAAANIVFEFLALLARARA